MTELLYKYYDRDADNESDALEALRYDATILEESLDDLADSLSVSNVEFTPESEYHKRLESMKWLIKNWDRAIKEAQDEYNAPSIEQEQRFYI